MGFITGASSGIGRGLALRLAADGYAVGLAARRVDLLRDVAARIRGAGGAASVHGCDASDRDQVRAAVSACRKALGPIRLLVANAGVAARMTVDAFDAADVERVLRINYLGAVYAVEAVLPDMLERGAGRIAAVASLAGMGGFPTRGAYCASKAAMITFFESLRAELRPCGITVTVLNPGYVRTPMVRRTSRTPGILELDDAVERMADAILSGRPALSFPRSVFAFAWVLRLLPREWHDRIVRRLIRSKGG